MRSKSHFVYDVACYEPLREVEHIIIIFLRSVLSVICDDIMSSSTPSLALKVTVVVVCTKIRLYTKLPFPCKLLFLQDVQREEEHSIIF
jgi:hypothetical protein